MKCDEFERALLREDGEKKPDLGRHASICTSCRERMEEWNQISRIARQMHRSWESDDLWPKIEQSLLAESARLPSRWREIYEIFWLGATRQWKTITAVALLVIASCSILWVLMTERRLPNGPRRLLTEHALQDIERAEAEYIESINRLSALVEPKVARPTSLLLANYKEKLMLIDAAIAECRDAIERNRFNVHLRRELLSMYQQKQRTLEQLARED